MPKILDVMIDVESLGVHADAAILSIGAVKFDPNSDEIANDGFYGVITVESNQAYGRRIDPDTLRWWLQQSDEAQDVFRDPMQGPLENVLADLANWYGNQFNANVWSNGADFDVPMIRHAYVQVGLPCPFGTFNARCYRTLKNLHKLITPSILCPPIERHGTHHNALDDAISQARHAQAIIKSFREPETNQFPSLAQRMAAAWPARGK